MMKSNRKNVYFLSALIFVCAGIVCSTAVAQKAEDKAYDCGDTEELQQIYYDNDLSDDEEVQKLSKYLYNCLSKMKQATGEAKSNAASQSDWLIHMIGLRFATYDKQRPEAVSKLIKSLEDDERKHADLLRKHLYISLGLAGQAPPEGKLLNMLKEAKRVERIKIILSAMANSRVPIRALPVLLELSDHPHSRTETSHAGLLYTEKRFPIRIKVCRCMKKLGIDCKKERIRLDKEETESGKEKSQIFKKYRVKTELNQESVVKKIKEWLLSDKEETWKAGFDVVQELDRDDVEKMLKNLKQDERLSQKKRDYYTSSSQGTKK